jgi:hypothetical protein
MWKNLLTNALAALFDGMLLMFAFPFVGLVHVGYFACVLIAYAAQAVISTGVYNGSRVAFTATVTEIAEGKVKLNK